MKIIYFLAILVLVLVNLWLGWAIEIIPERPVVEFFNKAYVSNMTFDIRRRSRNSPYHMDFRFYALTGFGNNLTVNFQLLEYLGSGWQPIPLSLSVKLCDFLYKDPFLGRMYANQLPANWSCPFPPGQHIYSNLTFNLDNFSYNLPFTWASINMKSRADVEGILTETREVVFTFKAHATIKMKPPKKN